MSDLVEDNVRLIQKVSQLSEELRHLQDEKTVMLNIINSDLPPPADYSDLGVWVNEMAADFAKAPFSTDTECSMWLHDWLCHIRATRQLGLSFEEEDIDG